MSQPSVAVAGRMISPVVIDQATAGDLLDLGECVEHPDRHVGERLLDGGGGLAAPWVWR